MQALSLIAHGSRRQASNDEVHDLIKDLSKNPALQFKIVECAFLELAIPSIPDGVSTCVQKGATEVTVLPYFLSAGRHIVEDIPAELEKSKQKHPQVTIKLAPYLGSAKGISDILVSLSQCAT